MLEVFLQQAISIFAIVDPIGVAAIMLSIAPHADNKTETAAIALKVTMTIIIAFFVVLLSGDLVLKIFGISLDSLKTMGGVVLFITALKMIEGKFENKNQSPQEQEEVKKSDDIAIIPLAIPITFGPGIFATIVIYKASATSTIELAGVAFAFMLTAIFTYFALKYSIYIKKYLGVTGQKIVTRLMGLIVGAIAVQFIVSGIVKLGKLYLL